MVNQPISFAQPPWYAQAWVRWLAIWLVSIGIGLPLMVFVAGIGGERAVNTFIRTGMVAIYGPAIQTYVIADTISRWLITLLPGATSGAVIGLGQWVLLPQRLRSVRTWILVSACGGAIAWWTANALFLPMHHLVIGFLRRTAMLDLGTTDFLIATLVAAVPLAIWAEQWQGALNGWPSGV